MSTSSSSTLAHLQQLFPNVIMVDSHDMATALGIAYKTVNNSSDFPIRCVRFGRKKYYRIIDIAAYVDSSLGITEQPIAAVPATVTHPPRRGRGRPPKVQAEGAKHG